MRHMENTKAPKPNRKQTKLSVAEWLHSAQELRAGMEGGKGDSGVAPGQG